jgi:hypothetical protein
MLAILTNSQDETASFLVSVLEKGGCNFIRLDTDCVIPRIACAYEDQKPLLSIDGVWHEVGEIGHVWYRRPEHLKDKRFDDSPESNSNLLSR